MDIDKIESFLRQKWPTHTGLISALFVVSISQILFFSEQIKGWTYLAFTLPVSILALVFLWYYNRRPPKAPKNKIGFLVSLSVSDNGQAQRLKEDFILPLRKLIKDGPLGQDFHFMELQAHHADEIVESEDAIRIRVRTNARFMLYGRVKLRELNDQEFHVLDVDGLVAHSSIPDELKNKFSAEFRTLLPPEIRLSKRNDLLGFSFTSEWTDIVARYIIGVAAAYSRDIDYAEKLLKESLRRLQGKSDNFPIYRSLKHRIPERLLDIDHARAVIAHRRWLRTHDDKEIEIIGRFFEQIGDPQQDKVEYINFKAIYVFLKDRDSARAIECLKRIKDDSNSTLHYNFAFLYAYQGDCRKSIRHYRKAVHGEVPADVLDQLESWMCWLLVEEPYKYQIHYCLGFFNWQAKGDLIRAKKDFENFLNSGDDTEFSKERELAKKWISEIDIDIGNGAEKANIA